MCGKRKSNERKKRCKGRFGEEKIKYSRKGQIACRIGVGAWLLLLLLLVIAYTTGGKAGVLLGSFGFIAMLFGVIGLYQAVLGFQERNCNYLLCRVGVGINGVLLFLFVLIFLEGAA